MTNSAPAEGDASSADHTVVPSNGAGTAGLWTTRELADELTDRVEALTLADRRQLGGRLRRVLVSGGEAELEQFTAEVAAAEGRLAERIDQLPDPTFPSELPITERVEELIEAIEAHQVIVVAGETGSGKSTQLPKIALAMGRGALGLIGHTQPRRIAARTVAERVASELDDEIGGSVAYSVRFTDTVGPDTNLRLMTDGILLAEIQRDRLLERYDTLILDEAHERSLNIDFLLGYLSEILPRRPDLKLIITSATIDTGRFSEHFGGAPIIEVSGRTFPVELRYDDPAELPTEDAIADAVEELLLEGPGDVLVFCAGEADIRDATRCIEERHLGVEVLPLYARLSAADQHKIFSPHQQRRVVVSTNVAETSLTVPGIRYVVDTGLARISRFGRRTKVQRLPIEPISQASANQRSGRCGRVAPGICIRLFSEEDFAERDEFTEPEILRTNLASVILQMASLRLGPVEEFGFVDPPDKRSITDGVNLLVELGALDPDAASGEGLTDVGRILARLPVDPRFGRMVLAADDLDCVADVIIIAAGLSIRDPRERPPGAEAQMATKDHKRFAHPDSDLLGWLLLWEHLETQRRKRSGNQFRKMCRAEHLNFLRIREWQDVERQLRQYATSAGIDVGKRHRTRAPHHEDDIHLAILTGLVSQFGQYDPENRDYKGPRNTRFSVGRESALSKKPPKWVMAAEMVDTNKIWARGVARIQPSWLEDAAPHLIKRRHSEPWWDPDRGEAVTSETVSLFGIQIVPRRTMAHARLNRPEARELFIHHALVEGEWDAEHDFVAHNEGVVNELRAREDRARRSLVTDHNALFDFYERTVGPDVVSSTTFESWWRSVRGTDPEILHASLGLLLDSEAEPEADDYPDLWHCAGHDLGLDYVFEPGHPDDGVTVRVPLAALNQVDDRGLDWQVPGLRPDLVHALMRTLPKPVRRKIAPIAEAAANFVAETDPDNRSLVAALAEFCSALAGEPIGPSAFDPSRVPAHLRVSFTVVDERGRRLADADTLAALQAEMAPDVRQVLVGAASSVEVSGCTSWTFGTLERVIESTHAGTQIKAYPGLVDEGETVGVRLFETRAQQLRSTWTGTRRLLRLVCPSATRAAHEALTERSEFAPLYRPHETLRELLDDVIDTAFNELLSRHGAPAWTEAEFAALESAVAGDLHSRVGEIGRTTGAILVARGALMSGLDATTVEALAPTVADIESQLAGLVTPGFVMATGADQLVHLERYLDGARHRLGKARENPARDRQLTRQVASVWAEAEAARRSVNSSASSARLRDIRWLLEEFRVSLFAQHLGTAQQVSERRIRSLIAELG